MTNILTAAEASNVLRCSASDALMLSLLPSVDEYIANATGHNWANDSTINETAKAAARILITQWYENPAMLANGMTALSAGLVACLAQLEALALRFVIFEGLDGAGSITMVEAHAGDTVTSMVGVVNATGDQSTKFESVISTSGYLKQTSTDNLSGKFYRAHLTPPTT